MLIINLNIPKTIKDSDITINLNFGDEVEVTVNSTAELVEKSKFEVGVDPDFMNFDDFNKQ